MVQVNDMQKEIIYKEITEGIGKCEDSQVLIIADLYLKRTSHRALLEMIYKQSKSIKEVQVSYVRDKCLQVSYWPSCLSVISLNVESEGIIVTHRPMLENHLEWTNDLTELVNNAISQHKNMRLRSLTSKGVLRDRLELSVCGENCVSIEISHFSGEARAYVYGKVDLYLTESLKKFKIDEIWEDLEKTVLKCQLESVCRGLNKALIQDPLRFSRIFHSNDFSYRRPNTIGYLDLGSILPTDSLGHILIFALRIFTSASSLSSELIGYNETEEEYIIPIESSTTANLEDFVKYSLKSSKEKIMLLRVPVMLLAKPQI